ncbi:MAG: AraC family transcriptional regulator [Lachnospiraceae bacterium]|nr:AraC family transcriptional regulator [Lachnospiraceae bacterium]
MPSCTYCYRRSCILGHHIPVLLYEQPVKIRSSVEVIQEISSFVGYLDNNYFVKVFKKQYGLTPTVFRLQY